MTVNLPNTNQSGKNEWADVEGNDVALKEAIESLETEVSGIEAKVAPIIRGNVSESGSVVAGSGFSSTKTGTGQYKITLTTELSSAGIIVVTPVLTGKHGTATAESPATKVFFVELRNSGDVLTNGNFYFMIQAS